MAVRVEMELAFDPTGIKTNFREIKDAALAAEEQIQKLTAATRDYSKIPVIYPSSIQDMDKLTKASVSVEQALARITPQERAVAQAMQDRARATQQATAAQIAETDATNGGAALTASALESLVGKWLSVAAAIAAVRKVTKEAIDATQDAAKIQHLYANLERNAQALTGATAMQTAGLKDWGRAISEVSGIGEERILPYMNKMLGVTHNLHDAMKLTQMAVTLEKRGFGDMELTFAGVTAAYEGQIQSRGTFGKMLRSEHQGTEDLIRTMSRMSETYNDCGASIKDVATETERANIQWEHSKRTVGEALIPLQQGLLPVLKFLGFELQAVGGGLMIVEAGFLRLCQRTEEANVMLGQAAHLAEQWNQKLSGTAVALERGPLEGGKKVSKLILDSAKAIKLAYESQEAQATLAAANEADRQNRLAAIHQKMAADTTLDLETRAKAEQEWLQFKERAEKVEESAAKHGGALAQAERDKELSALQSLAKAEAEYGKAKQAAATSGTRGGGTSPNAIQAGITAELEARRAQYAEEYVALQAAQDKELNATKLTEAAKQTIRERFGVEAKTLELKDVTDEAEIVRRGSVVYLAEYKKRADAVQKTALAQKDAEIAAQRASLESVDTNLAAYIGRWKADWAGYFNALEDYRRGDTAVARAEWQKQIIEANGDMAKLLKADQNYLKACEKADKDYFNKLRQEENKARTDKIAAYKKTEDQILALAQQYGNKNVQRAVQVVQQIQQVWELYKSVKAIIDATIATTEVVAAKVAFEAQKGMATGQAEAQTQVYAVNAASAVASTPYVGPILAAAAFTAAEAQGQAAVGVIQSTELMGMFHAGINRVPREGSYYLDGGEAVVPSKFNPYAFGQGGKGGDLTVHNDNRGAWIDDPKNISRMYKKMQRDIARGHVR